MSNTICCRQRAAHALRPEQARSTSKNHSATQNSTPLVAYTYLVLD
jgi:hypothetical protein